VFVTGRWLPRTDRGVLCRSGITGQLQKEAQIGPQLHAGQVVEDFWKAQARSCGGSGSAIRRDACVEASHHTKVHWHLSSREARTVRAMVAQRHPARSAGEDAVTVIGAGGVSDTRG
jgi:hypothetical protein